jgi:hypothetical protein
LRYEDVEDALVDIMQITPRKLGAFRAQLRYLRTLKVPRRLPKTGKGFAVDYTPQHALDMLVALELQKIGQTAQRAALVAGSIVRMTPYGQYQGEDCFACCHADRNDYTSATGLDQLISVIKSGPAAFAVINVSACVRMLEEAFNKLKIPR